MSESESRSILTKSNLEKYRFLVAERVKQWENDGSHDETDIDEGNSVLKNLEEITRNYDECAVLRKPLPQKDQEVLKRLGFTKVDDVPKWSNDMMRSLEKHGGSFVQYEDESSQSENEADIIDDNSNTFEDEFLDLPTLGDEKYEKLEKSGSKSFSLNDYLKEQENEVNKITSGLDQIRKEKEEKRRSAKKRSPPKKTENSPTQERMIQKALFDSISMERKEIEDEKDDISSSDVVASSSDEENVKEYPMNIPKFSGAPSEDMMLIMGYDDDEEFIPNQAFTKQTSEEEEEEEEEKKVRKHDSTLSPIEPPNYHKRKSSPPKTVKNQPKVETVAVVNEFVPPGLLSREKKLREKNQNRKKKSRRVEEQEEEDVIEHLGPSDDGDFDHILNLSQLEKETELYENQLLNKIHHLNPLKKEEEAKRVTSTPSTGHSSILKSGGGGSSTHTSPYRSAKKRMPTSSQFPLPTPPQFPRLDGMPKLPQFPHPPPSLTTTTTTTMTSKQQQQQQQSRNIITPSSHFRRKKTPSTIGSTATTLSTTSTQDGRNESLMMEEFDKIRTHELGQFKQFLKDVQGEFKEVFRNKLSKEEFYGMYQELKQEIEKIKSEKDDKLDREFQNLKLLIRKHIPSEEVLEERKSMRKKKRRRRKKKEMTETSSSPKTKKRVLAYSDDDEDDEELRSLKKKKRQLDEEEEEIEEEEEEEELDFDLRKREVRKMKKEEEERMQYHLMLNQTIKEENQMLRKFVRQIKNEMSNRKRVLVTEVERLKQLVGECSLKDFSSMPVKQQEFEKLTEYEMKLVQLETINGEQSSHQMYYPDDINDPIDHELSRLLNEMPIIGGIRIEIEKMERSKYLADQILHLKLVGGGGKGRRSRDGLLIVANMNNVPLEDYLMELYAPFVSEEKRRIFLKKNKGGRSVLKTVGGGGMMAQHERVGITSNSDDELLMMNRNPLSNLSNLPPEYELEMEGMVLPTGASPDIGMDEFLGRNQILEKMKFDRDYKSPALVGGGSLMSGGGSNVGVGGGRSSMNRGGRKRGGRGGRRGKGRGRGRKKKGGGRARSQQEDFVGRKRRGKKSSRLRGRKILYDY